jgi:hypothetical protein
MKIIAACVGIALAQWSAGSAFADSAVGVDTALGNALNPPGRSAVPGRVADDGYDTVRRSPSGQLYGLPYDRSDEGGNKTESGWEYSGMVEAGVLGGDAGEKNALFRKYKDMKNGANLSYFEVEADKPDSAKFIQAFGGGTGQHDQFYGMQFGRYNDWKMKLFYNETSHVFTSNWKSLFNGEGTGSMSTGLAAPVAITTGTYTAGAAGYAGATSTCTAAAPCFRYGGTIYSNATAQAAINGIAGTPLVTPGGTAAQNTGAIIAGSPQSNIALAISNRTAALPETELSLVRKKGGARFDMTLDNFWKGYASYSQEKRTGARPFAMNEGNISYEIAEPIDYTTHELLAGLQYADSLTQANLRASLSMFRNNIGVLNVRDPLMSEVTGNSAIQTATYDLYPDNNAFNLKGEFARNLPDFYKGRFTATVSWGTNRQDDNLLPPISPAQNADLAAAGVTTLTGTNIGYAANTALVSNWNTTAALSQQTSKQRIDNKLIDLGLSVKPSDDLNMKGSLRYYETDNRGGYMSYNPLTGQFGRGLADANGLTNLDVIVGLRPGAAVNTIGNCYIPAGYPAVAGCTFGFAGTVANGANVPVFGQARSTKQLNIGLSADYDLTRTSSLNAALEREEFKRNFRERDKTWEDKLKLGYVNRALGNTTLRTSFETDRKRGGVYNYRTFEDLGTGLPGLTIAEQIAAIRAAVPGYTLNANLFNRYSYYFRKYDQADRDQRIFNARLNVLAREDLDMGATVQLKNVAYPDSFYGLETDRQNSLTLDLNYQPSSGSTFYAFYSYQQGSKSMNLNSGVASLVNTACTLANLDLYGYAACSDNIGGTNGARPLASSWNSLNDDRNDVFGLGIQGEVGKARFGIDYTYSNSKTDISYAFGGGALSNVAATQLAQAAIAGSALPSMTFAQHTLNLNLLIPIDKRLSVRLFERYEIGKVKDWHYDGVVTAAVANYDSGTLLLDAGPQSYRANVFGAFFQYKL